MSEPVHSGVVTTMGRARADLPTRERPEIRLVVTLRDRGSGVLDQHVDDPPPDPSGSELLSMAAEFPDAVAWVIAGGEPTLRSDLPALIKGLAAVSPPRLVLATDGLVLTSERIIRNLKAAGVNAVRVRLHSHHLDAHDWLSGQKGAGKRIIKAIRTCQLVGLPVEVEATVTRVTRPYLLQTVEVLARLGAQAVCFRRPVKRGPADDAFIQISPRFGLTQPSLEAAVAAGIRSGMRMTVEGFPRCACPAAAAQRLQEDSVRWVVSSQQPWPFMVPRLAYPGGVGRCATCPGSPECDGAPSDYVSRFGTLEVRSEGNKQVRIGNFAPTPNAGGEVEPPPRGGRFPATRVRYVARAAARPSLSGDPLVGVRAALPPKRLRLLLAGPSRIQTRIFDDLGPVEPETTRDARVRLVQAAQHGAALLRIVSAGSLAHPEAPALLREGTRLSLPRYEVCGEGSALDEASDMQLRRLRGVHRLDFALFGPDSHRHDPHLTTAGAFDATMNVVDRLGRLTPTMKVGCFGVLTGPDDVGDWAAGWEMGDIPGEPAFRLASAGGALMALAAAAGGLPQGEARDALASVLPPCLLPRTAEVTPAASADRAWGDHPDAWRSPSNVDRLGCYNACSFAEECDQAEACPGLAAGWSHQGVSPVQTSNPE